MLEAQWSWCRQQLTTVFNRNCTRHIITGVLNYLAPEAAVLVSLVSEMYSVSQKNPPLRGPDIFHFFHERLRIFSRFFTHLLYVPIYARLQIFVQLSQILTKLCRIKRDYPVRIICSKCPQSAEWHALTCLRKSLIALLIVVCGK